MSNYIPTGQSKDHILGMRVAIDPTLKPGEVAFHGPNCKHEPIQPQPNTDSLESAISHIVGSCMCDPSRLDCWFWTHDGDSKEQIAAALAQLFERYYETRK